jgi:four helix bundle protein
LGLIWQFCGCSCAGIVNASWQDVGTQAEVLKARTFRFAVDTVNLVRKLPATFEARRIGGQLFDAGTSVGANYRAACKARSHAEFISKIGIVLEEADESSFWLDLLVATSIVAGDTVRAHQVEASELMAIFTASHKTASQRKCARR